MLIAVSLVAASSVVAESMSPLPLTLTDPRSGDAVDLEPGAPVLHVVFFATWCPPCRSEIPRLTELDTRWGDGGYRLVLVAVRSRQTEERLREFVTSTELEGEVLFDAEGGAQRAFEAGDLPTHVILDARGAIVARSGDLDEEVESTIESMMVDYTRQSGR